MSDAGILILDANVLASFDTAGWFDSFAFWTAEWEIVTAERVWDEYAVEQDIEAPPEWLTVETIDLNRIHAPTIGQLSRQDWSCIGLLETAATTKLVTNDSALKAIAEDRDQTVE